MARSRNIKPGLYQNEDLVTCSMAARYMAAGLPCWADAAGRLEDRPLKLKMQMFPADNVDANALLDELNRVGYVVRYVADNVAYIQIVSFEKHQNPHCKEPESTIPAPCLHSSDTRSEVIGYRLKVIDSIKEESKEITIREEKAENASFEEWWTAYNKKVDRKKCEAKWNRLEWKRLNITPEYLIKDTLNRHANCAKWAAGYQKNPLTYLNGECWNDELQRPAKQQSTPADEYELRQRRTAAIISEINGGTVERDGSALSPAMVTYQR